MAISTGGRSDGARRTTETKHALKTTEFWTFLVVVIAILIAGDSVGGGHGHDFFAADKVWLYVTILTVGYLVSRGFAKSGSREPYSLTSGTDGGITDRLTKAATVLREGDLPAASGSARHDPGPLGR
jgi:hypothetical protein